MPWKTEIFFYHRQDASSISGLSHNGFCDQLSSRACRLQECLKLCLATDKAQSAPNLNILLHTCCMKLCQFLLLDLVSGWDFYMKNFTILFEAHKDVSPTIKNWEVLLTLCPLLYQSKIRSQWIF